MVCVCCVVCVVWCVVCCCVCVCVCVCVCALASNPGRSPSRIPGPCSQLKSAFIPTLAQTPRQAGAAIDFALSFHLSTAGAGERGASSDGGPGGNAAPVIPQTAAAGLNGMSPSLLHLHSLSPSPVVFSRLSPAS